MEFCCIAIGRDSTLAASKCKHSMQPSEHSAQVAPLEYTTAKVFIVISSGGSNGARHTQNYCPLIPRNATWLYAKPTATMTRYIASLCKAPLVRRISLFLMLDVSVVVDVSDGGVELVWSLPDSHCQKRFRTYQRSRPRGAQALEQGLRVQAWPGRIRVRGSRGCCASSGVEESRESKDIFSPAHVAPMELVDNDHTV